MKKFLILFAALFVVVVKADTINVNWLNPDGTTYDTTTCTVGGDLNVPTAPTKRGHSFRGWAFYTPIEYLESTGTQYIDTGVKPNNNTRVVAEFMLTQSSIPGWLFMARNGRSQASFGVLHDGDGNIRTYYGNTDSVGPLITNFINKKLRVDKNKNITTIYDNAGTSLWNATNATNTFQSNYNMYVFAGNDGGTMNAVLEGMRIYSFQLYDNGTQIHDFIPVLDDTGTPCMLDTVSGNFFYNAGTGNFVAGPVISNQ